jgi:hypothetical protein
MQSTAKTNSEDLNSPLSKRRSTGFHHSSRLQCCKRHPGLLARLSRIALLVGFIASIPVVGSAEITLDSTSSVDSGSDSTSALSFSHTIAERGEDRILLVGVSLESTSSVNRVTYGDVQLANIGTRYEGKVRVELFKLVSPQTGTFDVMVNLESPSTFVVGAVSFTGVNQTSPHGRFHSVAGMGTSSSVTVTESSVGEVVIDLLARIDHRSCSPEGEQSQSWNRNTSHISGASSVRRGESVVHFGWNSESGPNDWILATLALRPSSVAPGIALDRFSARVKRQGKIAVKWETQYEVANLGFHVYREENGIYTRLTKRLIAGLDYSTGDREPGSYSWTDKRVTNHQLVRYWLESIDVTGAGTWHGPVVATGPDDGIVAIPQDTVR